MKKIIFISVTYYPSIGGIQRVTQNIAERCVKNGYDVYVLSLFPKNREITEHNKVRIHEIKTVFDILRYIKNIKPQIVYCSIVHNLLTIKFALLYYLFFKKRYLRIITIINSVGGYGVGSTWQCLKMAIFNRSKRYIIPKNIRILLLKLMNITFDYYIAMDEDGKDYLFDRRYISESKIRFISQGLNFKELENIKKVNICNIQRKYNIKFDKYFVCAHNFQIWKNHKDLLNFFSKHIDYNLILLGSTVTAHKEVLKEIEKYKGISNIQFIPDIPRNDFLSIIYNSSGHISFSLVEGHQNNVLLETMYLNIPYITSPATQDYSYFPNVRIWQNENELTKYLDNIFTIKLDIAYKGHQYCVDHTMDWNDIMHQYFNLFKCATQNVEK